MLLVIPLVNSQIAIQSFEASPEKILPGNQVTLKIRLENVGEDDIKNILVKLELNELPFAPLRSSTEKVIDELESDDDVVLYFDLIALPDATSQIYKIPVKISYDNIVKDSLISLEVTAKAKLDVILEDSDIVKVNDNGKIAVKFVNNGLTQIKFLKVTLQPSPAYEILSTNTVYIGGVDVDDFESEEFNIIPKIKNPQLAFNINYRDANNNEFSETKSIILNVYTEEEAKQLGLVKRNVIYSIVIPILFILVIIFALAEKEERDE
ncbi:MAG: hypothetical protein AABX55_02090, partial [Nanoarchaeota archaeon]